MANVATLGRSTARVVWHRAALRTTDNAALAAAKRRRGGRGQASLDDF
ncbi:hypothetical protein [Haloarcula marina]|nr:hypothetical protein [Halomicroarcula marina]